MNWRLKYLPILAIVGLLFLKDVALVICTSDNPLYWIENVDENEKADNNKEKEKKDIDDKKFTVAAYSFVSISLSSIALHVVSDRKYCSPTFDVVSPPPERA